MAAMTIFFCVREMTCWLLAFFLRGTPFVAGGLQIMRSKILSLRYTVLVLWCSVHSKVCANREIRFFCCMLESSELVRLRRVPSLTHFPELHS